ncbi:MAG: diguanylate cyclase [Leptolinea sp.]|jgi:diguanylate cyclase (GGDEF)-like protein/PAS domain S-box-containing protein|nr:diguanylate cyclase [Leptolinea sp.]
MIDTPQILLVEQEQSVINQITELIDKIGFMKPHVASTQDEAKRIAGITRPDIALVDLSMDVACHGKTTARMLSEEYNLPVIYLVSREDYENRSGVQTDYGFVFKPIDQRNLEKTIMLALSRHSQMDNFSLLISDLPFPALVIAADSLEVLICNTMFTDQFSGIECQQKLSDLSENKSQLEDEIVQVVKYQQTEKKSVVLQRILPTKSDDKVFTIHARQLESVNLPIVLITLVRNETTTADDLFTYSPALQLHLGKEGRILRASQKWLASTGFSPEDISGKPLSELVTDASRQNWMIEEYLVRVPSENEFSQTLMIKHKDGLETPYLTHFSILPGDGSILAVFTEEAGRVSSEEETTLANALRDTAEALTSTLNFDEVLDRILINVGLVVPNEAANVMMIWSGVAYIVRSIGYAERGLEESMMSLQIPISQESHFLSMYSTGMPLAVADTQEYAALARPSEINWARSLASAPLRSKGQVFGFLNLESSQPGFYQQKHADRLQAFADQAAVAIENARLYAEVQQYAITDELTDIYNRRGLFELGKREVERARRYGRSLSVVMIDTDGFKTINDTYSHAVGDHVLRAMADRWKKSVREVDILGRYGGDEFVVLLPETDLDSAIQVADRLRLAIGSKPIETPAGEIPLTVSLGVAEINDAVTTFDALIETADHAMFEAKTSGKNQVKH